MYLVEEVYNRYQVYESNDKRMNYNIEVDETDKELKLYGFIHPCEENVLNDIFALLEGTVIELYDDYRVSFNTIGGTLYYQWKLN